MKESITQFYTVSVFSFYIGSGTDSAKAKSYGSCSATLITGPHQALRIRSHDDTVSRYTFAIEHFCRACIKSKTCMMASNPPSGASRLPET
jgi:hypothetical protein